MAFKGSNILGKKVVEVRTTKSKSNDGDWYTHIDEIVFDDGSMLRFLVIDDAEGDNPIVEPIFVKGKRQKKK